MSSETEARPAPRTMLSALGVYGERASLVMVALGFSAGLPYFLIFEIVKASAA